MSSKCQDFSSWGIGYRMMPHPVQSLLKNGNRWVWEHLPQRSHFSARQTSRTGWSSADQGLDSRRLAQCFFFWWRCLGHLEHWLCGEEKGSPASCQQWNIHVWSCFSTKGVGSVIILPKTLPWIKNGVNMSCESSFFQQSTSHLVVIHAFCQHVKSDKEVAWRSWHWKFGSQPQPVVSPQKASVNEQEEQRIREGSIYM